MNCGIILLFLLLFNRDGRIGGDTGCGCEPDPPCRPREREGERNRERDCDCGKDRDRGRDRDCGRDRDTERDGCPCGGESRFEPRFDSRPFPDTGCGCNDK